jgi:hypothetical protein
MNMNVEDKNNEEKVPSRRMFASLALGAVVASVASISGTKKAHAEGPSEAQNAINTALILSELKEVYKTSKEWVQNWNNFVGAFNQSIRFAKDAYTMINHPENNIFYQQFKQMVDYVDTQLNRGGNFLDYHLDYLYPVLFDKIDSMMLQITNLNYRWKNLAMKEYLKNNPNGKEGDDGHPNTNYHDSNIGKLIRRISIDTGNNCLTRAKIQSFKCVSEEIKKSISNMPLNPGPPKEGQAPQKSRGQIFQELSGPVSLDIQIDQLKVLNEISMQLSNILLVMSKIGEAPIVAENEQVISADQIKQIIKKMSAGSSNIQSDVSILSKKK